MNATEQGMAVADSLIDADKPFAPRVAHAAPASRRPRALASGRRPGRSQRRSGGLTHERPWGSFAVERAVPEVRAFRAVRCLSPDHRRQPPWLRSRVQRDATECES